MKTLKINFMSAPLRGKIFMILVISGFVFSLINTVINYLLDLAPVTIFVAIITSLLCLGLLLYALKVKEYDKPTIIGFVILILFIYTSLWLANYGVRGSIPYFIILIPF